MLAALAMPAGRWWHGYELAKEISLKSGTLYPLLIRLHEQGLLEAEWRASDVMGRPPRHMYRLTPAGATLAADLASRDGAPAPSHLVPRPS